MTTPPALGLLVALALAVPLDAEQQPDRVKSPPGSSATQIGGSDYDPVLGYVGGKWIEIAYGRPIRRGRDIFGPDDFVDVLNDGAPVWRAGANRSTRLINEMPVEIAGKRIAAGEYTLFVELSRDKWTLIFSTFKALTGLPDRKDPDGIFGAYDYTPDRDLVRATMTLETLPHAHDQLHWEFLDVTQQGGRIALFWDKQMASVPFAIVP
jgi:Protein of unknown function (DUF2911)